MAFVIGLSAGATVLVGQAWGAKNVEKVRCVVGSTLYMTLIGGTLIAFLGVFYQIYSVGFGYSTRCTAFISSLCPVDVGW